MRAFIVTLTLAFGLSPAFAAGSIQRGGKLAKLNCGACHAIGQKGESPNAKATPFRDISKKYPVKDLEEALAEGIMVGHTPDMPQWRATPKQIDDLLAYLSRVQAR